VSTALATRNDSTPGTHNIPYSIVNQIQQTHPSVLANLFSNLIYYGVHPTQWKNARVVPIPKPSTKSYSSPESYRPISLISCLSKTLEKVMTKRAVEYGYLTGTITKDYMGSLPKISASDTLLTMLTPIQKQL
jgi:hypothetical protein